MQEKEANINPGCHFHNVIMWQNVLKGAWCLMWPTFHVIPLFTLTLLFLTFTLDFCQPFFFLFINTFSVLFLYFTEAVKVSCTWSSPSLKMVSMCWDRTALPLTPYQRLYTSTLLTNSRSEVQSTCPCCSLCWCRHSDLPGRPSRTSYICGWTHFWGSFKQSGTALHLLDWTGFWWFSAPSPTIAVVPSVSNIRGDWFTWNAIPELLATFAVTLLSSSFLNQGDRLKDILNSPFTLYIYSTAWTS